MSKQDQPQIPSFLEKFKAKVLQLTGRIALSL